MGGTECDVKKWVQVLYPHCPISMPTPTPAVSRFPSPVTAHQASKLLPTPAHLQLQLLEVGGSTGVGSIRS